MDITDWFSFGLAFVTGIFIGMFMYVTVFKPTYIPDDLGRTEDQAFEFSIVGKSYGGFVPNGYIHPSFRLLGNGEYTYLPGGSGSDALEPVKGYIPGSLERSINAEISRDNLLDKATPTEKNCRSYSDGSDYKYQITLEGTVYQLDTCRTSLSYDDTLSVLLDEVWNYLSKESQ